jgi:hypothetical protein
MLHQKCCSFVYLKNYSQSEFQNMVLKFSGIHTETMHDHWASATYKQLLYAFLYDLSNKFLYFIPQLFVFECSYSTDIWVLLKYTSLPVSASVHAHPLA